MVRLPQLDCFLNFILPYVDPDLGVPDENTRFRIGSIAKVFTALQTLIMRDRGSLSSLDDDIKKYYPEFSIINPFQTERGITFRQLMSHMSGLGRNAPCKGIFTTGCNLSDAEIIQNIAKMTLMYPPGTQPAYSNLGFGLLGKVLTRIAKLQSWDSLLSKLVTQPLGMKDTGNSFENVDPEKMAVGYYPDGRVAKLIDVGWDASAGQCYSSTADLAKLMSLIFSDQKSSKQQVTKHHNDIYDNNNSVMYYYNVRYALSVGNKVDVYLTYCCTSSFSHVGNHMDSSAIWKKRRRKKCSLCGMNPHSLFAKLMSLLIH